MDATLRAGLVEFLDREVPVAAPGFASRRPTREEVSRFSIRPFAYYYLRAGSVEQFVSFRAAKAGSSGQFIVECGWFLAPPIPSVTADSMDSFKSLGEVHGEVPKSLAIRLFHLCEGRGTAERFWDMFSPEAWDASRESYSAFSNRLAWAAVDRMIEIAGAGGPTAEYARRQAAIVGGDCVRCFASYGAPFLAGHARNVQA